MSMSLNNVEVMQNVKVIRSKCQGDKIKKSMSWDQLSESSYRMWRSYHTKSIV